MEQGRLNTEQVNFILTTEVRARSLLTLKSTLLATQTFELDIPESTNISRVVSKKVITEAK